MSKNDFTAYHELLGDIKVRVRQAQIKAALSVNATMILLYWDIGRMIAGRQAQQGWGAKVIPRLAIDLKNELPQEKGFSERNIKRMLRFFGEYPALLLPGDKLVPQAAALISLPKQEAQSMVPQAAAQYHPEPTEASRSTLLGIPW